METFIVIVVFLLLLMIFLLIFSVVRFQQTNSVILHNQEIISKNIVVLESDLTTAIKKVAFLDKKVEGYVSELRKFKEQLEKFNKENSNGAK